MCWMAKFLSLALFLVHVRALASENQESDFEHRSEKIGNTQILSDVQAPFITRPVLEVDLTDSRKNKLELENDKTLLCGKRHRITNLTIRLSTSETIVLSK